jgi:hypothetical protein
VEIEYIAGFPLMNRVAGDDALPVTMWALGTGGVMVGAWLLRRGPRGRQAPSP